MSSGPLETADDDDEAPAVDLGDGPPDEADALLRAIAHAPPVMPWPAPGELVGPYRLGACIGRGASAVVHRARDERLRRDVALKISRREHGEASLREARLLAAVRDPHVLTVFDVGELPAFFYIAMELADGSLRDQLSAPLPPARARSLALGIARGLAALHAHGIVHRDLKPENVVIDPVHGARVADLGIADSDLGGPTSAGTPGYLAPEREEDETNAGPPSDVYALGVILVEMLEGRRPGDRARPVRAVGGLAPLAREMLATDPASRPSAQEVASRLAAARPPRPTIAALAAAVLLSGAVLAHLARPTAPMLRFEALTHQPAGDPVLAMATHGSRIAYVTARRLTILSLTDGEERSAAAPSGADLTRVAWSSDETILVADEGGHASRVAVASLAWSPLAWSAAVDVPSPDGQYVARFGESDASIARVRGEESTVERAIDMPSLEAPVAAWSPDGALLAYSGAPDGGAFTTLRVMRRADGRSATVSRLAALPQAYGMPVFAWRGQTLVVAMTAWDGEPARLVGFALDERLAVVSEHTVALLPENRTLGAMAVAPDGSLVMLRSTRETDVVVVDASGERPWRGSAAREWPVAVWPGGRTVLLTEVGDHLGVVAASEHESAPLTGRDEAVVAVSALRFRDQPAIAYLALETGEGGSALALRVRPDGGATLELDRLPTLARTTDDARRSDARWGLHCAREAPRCAQTELAPSLRMTVRVVDLEHGETLGRFERDPRSLVHRGVAMTPEGDGVVVTDAERRCLLTLDLDGSEVARACAAAGQILQFPSYADDTLVAAGFDGRRYALFAMSAEGAHIVSQTTGWLDAPPIADGSGHILVSRTLFGGDVVRASVASTSGFGGLSW